MRFTVLCLTLACLTGNVLAAGGKAITNKDEAGPDFAVQGEYTGTQGKLAIGIHVIALDKGKFDGVLYAGGLPGAGWNTRGKTKFKGETADGKTTFSGNGVKAKLNDGKLTGSVGDQVLAATKTERKSPTLGTKPPKGAIVLFDGANANAWENGKLDGKFLATGTRTKQKFSNFTLHLEFRTPYMPASRGQGRGNSGMYLLDQYECQILDSFGLEGKNNECGGIYSISVPAVNMCLPPLSWQTYDVEFVAAKFEGDKKTVNAVCTIKHNGVVIHDKVPFPHSTPGGKERNEKAPASLFLQHHGNPVHFQNIWIVEN
jgi:hypothetical protein